MKILFTADWHIKLGAKKVPVEWQTNRYKLLFNKINEYAKTCDLLVVGGDIFDKVPTIQELALYFEFIHSVGVETIIYDGNHEATKKGETFLLDLKSVTENLNPNVKIITAPTSYKNIDIIPYGHIKCFDPNMFSGNILMTHVRGSIEPYVKPEINLDLLDRWEVVLAGDLHSYDNCQRNILYPGSPVSTSFHRNPVTNGIIIFDTSDNSHEFITLDTPQMIRKTVTSIEDAVPTEYDLTIYEVECKANESFKVTTEESHIDKKIVHRDNKDQLDLHGKSKLEELETYLSNILDLDDETIVNILCTFGDTIGGD